jgi:hypothetical protein
MKKVLQRGETASLLLAQPSHTQGKVSSFTIVEAIDRRLKAFIKGDISFCVTEQEVARGPISGHYCVETEGMQEPLFFLWSAQNGVVLNRNARSTYIAFDLRGERTSPSWTPVILGGACTGQLWTSVILVQVTGADTHSSIVSGIFVQIFVMSEDVLEKIV